MSTSLFIISNIKTSKEEVELRKDEYLKKLKNLNLEHTSVLSADNTFVKSEGDWEYEYPMIYNEKTDSQILDPDNPELIYFTSPFVFDVAIFEESLVLATIYKYRYLYEDSKINFIDNFNKFRKNIFDIISIFGGTEIIYLADNGCNKLSSYFELKVLEGVSYNQVKNEMLHDGTAIERDYMKLKIDTLSYGNITEYIFDDFSDFKN
ncbi:hypothetical protein Lupro_11885 [Lutibacter profundi]|uniref:Uncharacterized protein n=1 Tax=Lutibacter profundi TaxID=1622118 RepID=A0A0X8G8A6_9FLAO|nr:hypothetical protein [Lutibacter profundi]AMC11923.1 hypothetical protein Lupro_11885 [Lutibacter profundi]